MVSDQEIANGVETLLRQSDPSAVTSLNGVVKQLEAKLGFDLSHKAGFIRDQINLLLRSHPVQQPPPPPQQHPQQQQQSVQKDHFALQHYPQFAFQPQQFSPHFALQHHNHHLPQLPHDLNFRQPQQSSPFHVPAPTHHHHQPQQQQQQLQQPRPNVRKPEVVSQTAGSKESAPVGAKRRGGPGGLTKVCGVTPELQAVVGEPALPRTEIVKQLWAYIRKNNLQDPSNKRKIICDDALRIVFETDCTDMFKMNKLLSKHIIPLGPKKEPVQAKRLKVEVESATESTDSGPSPVIISEALAKFLGTGGREMLQTEATKRVWEYIKLNNLEDPINSMVILCDANLRELLGCESISALGIQEMLARNHFFRQS